VGSSTWLDVRAWLARAEPLVTAAGELAVWSRTRRRDTRFAWLRIDCVVAGGWKLWTGCTSRS
jgi:hypothetical protein